MYIFDPAGLRIGEVLRLSDCLSIYISVYLSLCLYLCLSASLLFVCSPTLALSHTLSLFLSLSPSLSLSRKPGHRAPTTYSSQCRRVFNPAGQRIDEVLRVLGVQGYKKQEKIKLSA